MIWKVKREMNGNLERKVKKTTHTSERKKNRSNIRHEFWGTVQIHNLDGQNNTGET